MVKAQTEPKMLPQRRTIIENRIILIYTKEKA
jgi:hypothetical protein